MTPQEIAAIVPIVFGLLAIGLIVIKFATRGGNSDAGKTKQNYVGGSTRQYNKTW